MSLEDVLSNVATELQHVAVWHNRVQELANGIVAPHHFIVERRSIDPETGRGLTKGKDEKVLGLDCHRFTIHCWGAKEQDCEAMRACLKKSFTNQLNSGNYRLGSATWAYPEWSANVGLVLSVSFEVFMPLVDPVIPTTSDPTQSPEDTVLPNTAETVTITAVEQSASGATPGDKILQVGET